MRTFTLGSGANVVKYSGTGETAVISSATAVSSLVAKVKEVAQSGADTINNVKAGDKIILNSSLKLSKYGSNNVVDSNTVSTIDDLNANTGTGDVFVLKDGSDYFLVYEADGSGTAGSLGSGAEVIKLVGFTDSNTISVDGTTITIGQFS